MNPANAPNAAMNDDYAPWDADDSEMERAVDFILTMVSDDTCG